MHQSDMLALNKVLKKLFFTHWCGISSQSADTQVQVLESTVQNLSKCAWLHSVTAVEEELKLLSDHVLSLDSSKANASVACNLEATNCCVNHELADNKGCPLFSRWLSWARWHGAIH